MAIIKQDYGSIGGGVKVWENPDPTNTFNATTLPFNMNGAKAVVVKQIFNATYATDISYDVMDISDGVTTMVATTWHNPYTGSHVERTYTAVSNGVSVSATTGDYNNYAIPQYVKVFY